MKSNNVYVDVDGDAISLGNLDGEERRLVDRLRRRARTHPGWTDFDNYWPHAVAALYDARGLPRAQWVETVAYRIAEDLSARLGIAEGHIEPPGSLDELDDLVLFKYGSRRAFCQATGIPHKLLDDFMAGRGDLSLKTLIEGLQRIGYRLRIM